MTPPVSVDQAISKGQRMVNYPALGIMFGTIGLSMLLVILKLASDWVIPLCILFAFVFALLWWSIMITKWRIWAFENVRNVHELKKRAIQEKLIWPDGSFFEKTEIRTAADKEKLNALAYKFNQEDVFEDDYNTANESVIYYSKAKNYIELALMLFCFGFGIYLLVTSDDYIIGSLLTIVGAYLSFREFKQATNTEPQIILNENGIQTINTEFYSWKEIENEEVVAEGSGKHTNYYLVYDHPAGSEHLKIDDYNIDMTKLNKLLILYRGRSKKRR